jgi:hypothetical protein
MEVIIKKMNEQQMALHKFFSEKAKHLQNEIDLEIEKVGGEGMLISREDLIHWVYHARNQLDTYHTICRMLEDKSDDTNTDMILKELWETMETDKTSIERLRKKQLEEKKALEQLREEAEYYRLALEVLGT